MFKKKVKAYWWIEKLNFGDALAPLILERFANVKVEWGAVSQASVVAIGSILEHIPPLWKGNILGAGKLIQDSRLHLSGCTTGLSPKIWAIRGPLSAKGIPGSYALGDPGLLADELVDNQPKVWDLGIVPHWQDLNLALNPVFYGKWSTKVIHANESPLEVVKQIGQCRKIVTSSLHGLIIADSWCIPRRLEVCKAMEKDGGLFKFKDYSESIQHTLEVGKVQEPLRFRVEDRQQELYEAYYAFGKSL